MSREVAKRCARETNQDKLTSIPMEPGGDRVPKECFSADDIEIQKTRRRRKKKIRRRKKTFSDGGEADDEDEYGPQNILEYMCPRTSIGQLSESGLSGFSGGVDLSSDQKSDDQGLFTISKVVDPDVMAKEFVHQKYLRKKALKPPRRKRRQRQIFVSQPELDRAGYIGPTSRGGQYSLRLRARSDEGLASLAYGTPETTSIPDCNIENNVNNKRQGDPMGSLWSRRLYPVDSQMSELLQGDTPFASGGHESEHRRRTWSIEYSSYNDHNVTEAARSSYDDDFVPWSSGELSNQHVFHEGECSWDKPKTARVNQRSFSVPEIVIQESPPNDWRLAGGRGSPSVGFEEEFKPSNSLRVPGYAKRIIPNSTKATILSFANELSRREDLYTEVLRHNAAQSTGVVRPLTQENVDVHNKRHGSEDDSCYYSIGVTSQSQYTRIHRAQRRQYAEHSSSDGIPRTSASYHDVSICSCSAHSQPTFIDDVGYRNDACTVDDEGTPGAQELTVVQSQEEANQKGMPSGRRVYMKLVKCVVCIVIFAIVLICVLTLTSRDDY